MLLNEGYDFKRAHFNPLDASEQYVKTRLMNTLASISYETRHQESLDISA